MSGPFRVYCKGRLNLLTEEIQKKGKKYYDMNILQSQMRVNKKMARVLRKNITIYKEKAIRQWVT